MKRSAEKMRLLGKLAVERGLRTVLETHDAFSTGAQVAELLDVAGDEGTGALWDLHHPYMVWYYLGAMGLLGTIGMILFYFLSQAVTRKT